MSGSTALRTALLAGGALAASLAGASLAAAQEAAFAEPAPQVDFADPVAALRDGEGAALDLRVRDRAAQRFAPAAGHDRGEQPRRVELELAAGGGDSPLDVSIAQRASLGADANGDLARQGAGSELRIGRGLVQERDSARGRSVYVFVASDDEALTWQPGARSEFGGQGASLAMQDRVEVGDLSAGVTYERNGVQASLAYVEREESTRVGRQSFSQDESFTGVTVTMRR
jgi:hypothetical protein